MAKSSSTYETLEGILPCPFCGEFEEEKQNFLAKVINKQGWYSIRCDGCGCNPSFVVHTWEECVRLWNSRVDFGSSNEFFRGIEAYKRHLLDMIKEDY